MGVVKKKKEQACLKLASLSAGIKIDIYGQGSWNMYWAISVHWIQHKKHK